MTKRPRDNGRSRPSNEKKEFFLPQMIHIIPKLHNTRVCETMSIYLELREITALLINGLQCEEDFGETILKIWLHWCWSSEGGGCYFQYGEDVSEKLLYRNQEYTRKIQGRLRRQTSEKLNHRHNKKDQYCLKQSKNVP